MEITLKDAIEAMCAKKKHPYIGKYCVVRCYRAGVHAGEVVDVDGEAVFLKNSRRLHGWKAQNGYALSGVAFHGIDASKSRTDTQVPEQWVSDCCELIPCSQKARESIEKA